MKSACHNSPVKQYANGNYCSVCFQKQHETRKNIWVLYIALSVSLMMPANPLKAPSIDKPAEALPVQPTITNDIIPTDSSVLVELVEHHCVLPSVAVAQARIESANYTSDIAVGNKNLFGIKVHKCKYVTGERKGHATFASYKDNIACYCHIQQRYLNKIDKSYAEDPLYIQKVKLMK